MTPEIRVPPDPLAFIRECVRTRQILWTYHVNMRLAGRFISRRSILESTDTYEIIESYPFDRYQPSYLVLASHERDTFHIVFAVDVPGDNVRIVTAYRRSPDHWFPDKKTRRKAP